MSVGGTLYLACDGEELLGDAYPMPPDTGSLDGACAMASEGTDAGMYLNGTMAHRAEEAAASDGGWHTLTRAIAPRTWRLISGAANAPGHLHRFHLCPACWKIWEQKRKEDER